MADRGKRFWRILFGVLTVGLTLTLVGSTHNELSPGTTYTAEEASRTVHLEDNSTAMLKKGSAVEERYTPEVREVELPLGEVLFRVVPDPKRPFRVRAGDTIVEVVGTVFAIDRQPDHTDILVTQGRISVNYGQSRPTQLDAGTSLRIQPDRVSTLDLTADDRDARLRWANPLIEPKHRKLSEIVDSLNEFNDTRLVIKDLSIADLPIGSSIGTLTQPELFATGVPGIRAKREPDENGKKVIGLYRAKKRR